MGAEQGPPGTMVDEIRRAGRIRMPRQKFLKHRFIAQFTRQRHLQVLRSPLLQQLENLLVTEIARHGVRGAVRPQLPDVNRAARTRILLRKPLLRYARADASRIGVQVPPHQVHIAQRRRHQNVRPASPRYLVARGCRTDILMAAALGDVDLVRRHLDADAGCIRTSVSEEWFPKQDPRAGGTVYIWKLGAHRTAHSVARDFGHEEVFQLLKERTPEDLKMALACELGDEAVFQEFLSRHPDAAKTLSEPDQRKLPNAAQNNNTRAVRLMLEAGWPVDTPGEMGATALHWAGFNGNAEMIREILRFHPALELKSREHEGTPLGWALYGSGNGWHRDTGDFVGTIRALLDAGATLPPHAEELEPSDAVLEVLP